MGYTDLELTAEVYADQLATQMRKGFLAYCVLVVCHDTVYTSDIIKRLQAAELVVVEGTIYPLLSRLRADGLLTYEWQESEQGPPRKYYQITPFGTIVRTNLHSHITALTRTLSRLAKESQ